MKGPLGGALVDDVPRLKRVKLRRPASGSLKAERARLLIRINVRTWAQRQQKTRLKAFLDCGCRFFLQDTKQGNHIWQNKLIIFWRRRNKYQYEMFSSYSAMATFRYKRLRVLAAGAVWRHVMQRETRFGRPTRLPSTAEIKRDLKMMLAADALVATFSKQSGTREELTGIITGLMDQYRISPDRAHMLIDRFGRAQLALANAGDQLMARKQGYSERQPRYVAQ